MEAMMPKLTQQQRLIEALIATGRGTPVESRSRKYVILKRPDGTLFYVGKAGGIANAYKIACFAYANGMATTIGSNLELGIGSAAMTHLALARAEITAETYACDIIGPMFYEDDILVDPLPITGGEARVHEKPGLGVELNDEKVEKYRVR